MAFSNMKRTVSSDSPETLFPEATAPTSLDHAVEQCPLDIARHGVDQTKCILGSIFMIWLKENEDEIESVVSVSSSSQVAHRFRIFFKTSEDLLTLAPHDEFRLSLYGAELKNFPQIPKLSTLSLGLIYTKGVHMEWKSRGSEQVRKTNTWLLNEVDNPDNSWFGTPTATLLVSQRKQDGAPPQEELRPRRDKEDKKRRRLEAKRQQPKAMVAKENIEVSAPKAPLAPLASESGQNDAPQVPGDVPASSVNVSTTHPHEEQPSGGPLDLQAGFRAEGVVYTAINDIQLGQTAHLVGIVTEISEPLVTQVGDWMRFVHIVDPSNHGSRGLKINCFTKKYKEWLPHPEMSHVLVLQNVKVVSYLGNLAGTGYSDKLRWAAFSPSENSVYYGQLKDVPREEGLADGGFGVLFSPFYQPNECELQYCSKLSDWWREMQKRGQSESLKYTVDPVRHQQMRRVHRLISEAGPSVPPQGYFDCTVEILKEFSNFNGIHTVYVTDYTRNNQTKGVQGKWCPTPLSDFVLQIEMWDEAAKIGQTMREGEYYLIKNARMRASREGFLEGKVSESKIIQLDEEDAQTNSHLQALLERKKVWAAKQAKPDTEIEHQLIQDAEDSKFFHCTVELIHAVYSTSDIYVTDYTSHHRLGKVTVNEAWSKGLEKCLTRIRLSEEQRHIAESATVGSFYYIKKLRLKYSPTEECFRGFLGGSERLVQVLNPNKTDNEHLNALLRRREAWHQKAIQPQQALSASPTQSSRTTSLGQSYTCIKDIDPEDTGIQKYRIFARAVDFYPLKLEDAFYQFCKRCNVEIPKSRRACFGCSDFEHECIQYLYQLYIMIEDKDGKQIMVSVNDECPLLEGLERVYISDNVPAQRSFRERLKIFLGNLALVHSGLLSEKKIEIDSPFGVYEVDSWVTPKGKRAYCLIRYDKA